MSLTRPAMPDIATTHSGWRLPRFGLKKKHSALPHALPIIADSSLAIDTRPPVSPTIQSSNPHSAYEQTPVSSDDRFSRSYNSEDTRSSDSNQAQQTTQQQKPGQQRQPGSPYRSASHTPLSSTTSTAVSSSAPPFAPSSRPRSKSKSEKYRLLSRLSNNNFKAAANYNMSVTGSPEDIAPSPRLTKSSMVSSPTGGQYSPSYVPPSPRLSNARQQQLSQSTYTSPNPKSPTSPSSAATRFIRRVASAPNAKRLFSSSSSGTTKNGLLAAPAEIDAIPPVPQSPNPNKASFSPPVGGGTSDGGSGSLDTLSSKSSRGGKGGGLKLPGSTRPTRANSAAGYIDPHIANQIGQHGELTSISPTTATTPRQAFRRTYSSNSIKMRSVQVGPSSFQKIKLLGRGDVGRVYLVREKKTDKLFAMKGGSSHRVLPSVLSKVDTDLLFSFIKEGDDFTAEDQASTGRTGDPGDGKPSIHRHPLPFIPVG